MVSPKNKRTLKPWITRAYALVGVVVTIYTFVTGMLLDMTPIGSFVLWIVISLAFYVFWNDEQIQETRFVRILKRRNRESALQILCYVAIATMFSLIGMSSYERSKFESRLDLELSTLREENQSLRAMIDARLRSELSEINDKEAELLRLRDQISELRSENSELGERLAEYNDEISEQADQFRSEIEQLEKQNSELSSRLDNRTRSLSAQQRSVLVERLKGGPTGSITVSSVLGDSESESFQLEIVSILNEAGWETKSVRSVYLKTPVGLTILAPGESLEIDALYVSFKEIGFDIKGVLATEPNSELNLIVGANDAR